MDWPKDDRIVCYCGCPHHLSSIRGSQLIDDGGYELHLTFHDVGPESTIEVGTPSYTVEGELKELATGTVRA